MDVTAKLRYLRISPRKVRLVLDLIRGRDLGIALQQLAVLPKRSSMPLMKLLKSAKANAEHNFKLDAATLFIKSAYADEGPKLKRFMPRAMGRATPVLKRMSHVTVVLGQRNEQKKVADGKKDSEKKPSEAKARVTPFSKGAMRARKTTSTHKKERGN